MPYLPHIYPVGATFFITFRLADSLPQYIVSELKATFAKAEIDILNEDIPTAKKNNKIQQLRKEVFGTYDHQLDSQPYGACYMNNSKVAQIIWDKVFAYSNQYYKVDALSIMPNHVHMLLDTSVQLPAEWSAGGRPPDYVDVDKWMQLIKGGSAYSVNRYLGRTGTLWAKESYDHFVRYDNDGEYSRIKDYIAQNPVVAGLSRRYLEAPYLFVT